MKIYHITVEVSGWSEVDDWCGGVRDAPMQTKTVGFTYLIELNVTADREARAISLATDYDYAWELGIQEIDYVNIEYVDDDAEDTDSTEEAVEIESTREIDY